MTTFARMLAILVFGLLPATEAIAGDRMFGGTFC